MCTAISFNTKNHYFGRTLDLDRSYGEQVCVMPRRLPLFFRHGGEITKHYAIIGMATVVGGKPLFYDAANEHGLAIAGLNFPENAYYAPLKTGADNIASFEFIPWVLSQCKTVAEVRTLLSKINICDTKFSDSLPTSPLHWMICDRNEGVVAEPMRDGLHIHENPVGVMTNNPPFEQQLANLEKYRHLKNDNSGVKHSNNLTYSDYSQGLGAVGLPGDVSSMSRFVRASFFRKNSVCEGDELSSVGQFFHILSSVEMVRGACKTDGGAWDITGYTSCINTDRGLYYYTTYQNRRISCVDMHKTDLDGDTPMCLPLVLKESVEYQN